MERAVAIVLPQFSSEPWFEPELFRTWPMSGSKFRLQLELNVRFSLQFRQLCILLNPFKRVRTHPNWYNIWRRICEFHGVMAITNIYFSLLTYHKHNFLTPVWPNFSRPIENGKPGSRRRQAEASRCYQIYLSDSVCIRTPYSSSRKLWGWAPSLIHGVLRCP